MNEPYCETCYKPVFLGRNAKGHARWWHYDRTITGHEVVPVCDEPWNKYDTMFGVGVLLFALVLAAFWFFVNRNNPDPGPICVPEAAVDYRGDLNAWLDADGRILIYAEQEDQYLRC
jgi:hypothetical protein